MNEDRLVEALTRLTVQVEGLREDMTQVRAVVGRNSDHISSNRNALARVETRMSFIGGFAGLIAGGVSSFIAGLFGGR